MKLIVILIHSFLQCLSNTSCDGKQLLDPGEKNKRKERKDESFEYEIIIMSVFSVPLHKGSWIPYSPRDNDSRQGVSQDEHRIARKVHLLRGRRQKEKKGSLLLMWGAGDGNGTLKIG